MMMLMKIMSNQEDDAWTPRTSVTGYAYDDTYDVEEENDLDDADEENE